MAKIRIDNQEYDTETFSADAKAKLQSLQFVEAELSRLAAKTAVYQTARVGYINALKRILEPGPNYSFNDVIKFD